MYQGNQYPGNQYPGNPYPSNQYQNTSGQGSAVAPPPEIRGWNWGGFLLGWIWAVGNGAFLWAVIAFFVPFFNIALGIKGNEWAWQSKRWNSIEHFRDVQRKWMIGGLIFWGVAIVGGCLLAALFGLIAGTASINTS